MVDTAFQVQITSSAAPLTPSVFSTLVRPSTSTISTTDNQDMAASSLIVASPSTSATPSLTISTSIFDKLWFSQRDTSFTYIDEKAVLCRYLDIAAVNKYIIYKENSKEINRISRKAYIKELNKYLIRNHARNRVNIRQTPTQIKKRLAEMFPGEVQSEGRPSNAEEEKLCYLYIQHTKKLILFYASRILLELPH